MACSSFLIDAVEHETMQMNIEIGCGAKSLYQRDSAGVGRCAFQPRFLEQKPRDDAVDDAQHRHEQFGVRRKHPAGKGFSGRNFPPMSPPDVTQPEPG